jgi:hypothetical protein
VKTYQNAQLLQQHLQGLLPVMKPLTATVLQQQQYCCVGTTEAAKPAGVVSMMHV